MLFYRVEMDEVKGKLMLDNLSHGFFALTSLTDDPLEGTLSRGQGGLSQKGGEWCFCP